MTDRTSLLKQRGELLASIRRLRYAICEADKIGNTPILKVSQKRLYAAEQKLTYVDEQIGHG